MAITIQCAACGRRYQAADHMAGRRVRCKHCGTTFQLPAEPTSDEPFVRPADVEVDVPASAILDQTPSDEVEMAPAPAPPPRASAAPQRPTPEIPPPYGDEPFDPESGDVDSVFQEAFQEYAPSRGNTPFYFPGSDVLDRWLPTVMVGICVVWLAYMTLGSGSGEPPWVGAVRLMILLLTYTGVVFPICLKGIRMAAKKLNYELPSSAPWRAFSTFLLPVTTGCVLWLSSASVPGFVFGVMLGLIVTLPIMWLLFRIRSDDAPTSLGYGAGAFGAAVLGSVILLAVLNLVIVAVIRATKSEQTLAMSPFGPNFSWDAPPPPAADVPKTKISNHPKRGEPVAPTTKAFSELPLTDATPATQPVETANSSLPSPPPLPPRLPMPANPLDPSRSNGIDAQEVTPTIAQTRPATSGPIVKPPEYGIIVAEVFKRLSAPMQAIVLPTLPGKAIAVVGNSTRANEDRVELVSERDWQSKKAVALARAATGGDNYQLNSEGTLLARVADFPYLSAQIYSFAEERLLRPYIKLDPAAGQPHLLGFCATGQLMILYGNGGRSTLDIWDVDNSKRIRRMETGGVSTDAGSYTFSRDGKLMAAIVRGDEAPGVAGGAVGRLDVYDLTSGRLIRKILIDELQWNQGVKPSGVSFSEESDKIAVLFEHQGQGLFLCWDNKSDIPIHQHIYPGGLLPEGVDTHGFNGQSFDLVDDANAWMLYGASVFDSQTGKLLGDLGIKNVKSQRVVSRDTVLLVQEGEGGVTTLLEVRLDVQRARREALSKR